MKIARNNHIRYRLNHGESGWHKVKTVGRNYVLTYTGYVVPMARIVEIKSGTKAHII